MPQTPDKSRLRLIPAIDEVLAATETAGLGNRHPALPLTRLARDMAARARDGQLGPLPDDREGVRRLIVEALVRRVEWLRSGGMRPVINATGVVLHTNLGRAVLGTGVRRAIDEAAAHYLNLEVDLESGQRGHRAETVSDLLSLATGAECAMVVNNNAAAVYLVVNSYSPPGRVLISRGELVEIGGSFRLPDILQRASLEMIEVGTTNRTYASDFAKVARPGDILMRAHRSNYDIQGFTHEPELGELVELAKERECHVVYDLGSGCLFDFDALGVKGEERISDVLDTGIDCVTMSGDKLLGGVQAGIILGTKKFLDRLKDNPLRRAVRVDKLTIAALQSLMRTYLFDRDPCDGIPTLRQGTMNAPDIERRAHDVLAGVPEPLRTAYRMHVREDTGAIGGGSFAGTELGSAAVTIECETDAAAVDLARRLRTGALPVVCRIKGNEIGINLRSVLPEEDRELGRMIVAALRDGVQ